MRLTVRKVRLGLRGLGGKLLHGYPLSFDPNKQKLLDAAMARAGDGPEGVSFADLGGVWRVDAAYTFYLLDRYRVSRAHLVDTNFTAKVKDRAEKYPNLRLLQADFSSDQVVPQVGRTDCVVFFDVLLHQSKPTWADVLRMWGANANHLVIFNQQFVAGKKTVRLIDLGLDEYFRHVRFSRTSPGYRELVERPDEICAEYGRPYRDVHNVWQWGITDDDLIAEAEAMGFRLEYRANHGRFSDFDSFENHAFLFSRPDA